jgi:hypothetical protein
MQSLSREESPHCRGDALTPLWTLRGGGVVKEKSTDAR